MTQIQRQISELRKALGADAIDTRSTGYALRAGPDQVDLLRFERLAAEGAHALGQGDAARAAGLLREALDLWRGRPLEDFAYDSFAQTPIGRLEEMRLAALEQQMEAQLALGRAADLVGELETLVSDHRLHEGFHRQLMLALYRCGWQAEALEVYRKTRATLDDEFGLVPTPALSRLERAILMHDPALEVGAGAGFAEPGTNPERRVLILAPERSTSTTSLP